MTNLPEYMLTYPTVFAVGDYYEIIVPFTAEIIMWVTVGDSTYYDDANGILRSNTEIHRVKVPMELLNKEKKYTVIYRKMIERTPYFPTSEDEREITIDFRPVKDEGDINLYFIADSHCLVDAPVAAAKPYADALDFLVLGGDIPEQGDCLKNFTTIHKITSGITHGEIPTVYARGNHDTRGIFAEKLTDYIPTRDGKTYYTFRVGSVWGFVIDCGEDKDDTSIEYGNTVCFHNFRLAETEYIKEVIANGNKEYAAPGVKHRLIISHVPFTYIHKAPFDIEQEIYREWTRLIGENVKPNLMICGHRHLTKICPPGSEDDDMGQPCHVIIGSKPIFDKASGNHSFIGSAITLMENGKQRIIFSHSNGDIISDEII